MLVIAVILLIALLGSEEQGGDPKIYRTTGEAICRDYRAAIGKLGQPSKVTDIGPYIERALPVFARTVARIEKLDPPGDLRDAFAEFRDAVRAAVARAEAIRAAAAGSDGDEVQRLLAEAAKASERRRVLAGDAGLKACAEI